VGVFPAVTRSTVSNHRTKHKALIISSPFHHQPHEERDGGHCWRRLFNASITVRA